MGYNILVCQSEEVLLIVEIRNTNLSILVNLTNVSNGKANNSDIIY